MQFRTKIPIANSSDPISYESKVFSIGSCFATNISEKFDYFQFSNTVNPVGILFHPLAIEKFIRFAVEGRIFTEADVFFHNERWHCFDAHSDMSDADQTKLLGKLNAAIEVTGQQLSQTTHVIITLGTAWAYRYSDTGELVANCHKVPQKHFSKELLSMEMIVESLDRIIAFLKQARPDIRIILTVSPVRHIKDGFPENQWSKANLISAVHQTILRHGQVDYFPSYEIMVDELRDYRFYADDMLHPSQQAIDYIWEQFAAAWLSKETVPVMEEISGIRKALAHRPFNPDSESHRVFRETISTKIKSLALRFPNLTFNW